MVELCRIIGFLVLVVVCSFTLSPFKRHLLTPLTLFSNKLRPMGKSFRKTFNNSARTLIFNNSQNSQLVPSFILNLWFSLWLLSKDDGAEANGSLVLWRTCKCWSCLLHPPSWPHQGKIASDILVSLDGITLFTFRSSCRQRRMET